MIRSRKDLAYYLEADRLALGVKRHKPRPYGNEIWKFQSLLRKAEYRSNCKKGALSKPLNMIYRVRLHRLAVKLGFSIAKNVFGPGLNIAHRGTIVVSTYARIGANCRIHSCVNIGVGAGTKKTAPIIGNNVYIGPGAKIFGRIKVGDDIAIGANSVVNKSFTEPGISIAGIPAKKISDKGSDGLLTPSSVKIT